jgi:hypothetical protein
MCLNQIFINLRIILCYLSSFQRHFINPVHQSVYLFTYNSHRWQTKVRVGRTSLVEKHYPYSHSWSVAPKFVVTFFRIQWCVLCQSSWLQIQSSELDSRRYQIFWEVVRLERGPLSLVSTIEELLGRKSSGSGLAIWEYGRRGSSALTMRHSSTSKSWH